MLIQPIHKLNTYLMDRFFALVIENAINLIKLNERMRYYV